MSSEYTDYPYVATRLSLSMVGFGSTLNSNERFGIELNPVSQTVRPKVYFKKIYEHLNKVENVFCKKSLSPVSFVAVFFLWY